MTPPSCSQQMARATTTRSFTYEIVACVPARLRESTTVEDEAAIPKTIPEIAGYTDFELIGAGGFCTVYRARQTGLDRVVAVKIPSVHLPDEVARRSFERERRAAAALSEHPSVVALYDGGVTSDGRPFLVFQFCPGGSLADQLAATGTFSLDELIGVGCKIADALAAAHAVGVYHRDVKSANILRTAAGDPALGDFGIASLSDYRPTATLGAMTPSHAPPEAFHRAIADATPADLVAWDIYALGTTLYELASGQTPFIQSSTESLVQFLNRVNEQSPAKITPSRLGIADAPRWEAFENIVLRALAKTPSQRFSSAQAMRHELIALSNATTELPKVGVVPVPTMASVGVAETVESVPAVAAERGSETVGVVLSVPASTRHSRRLRLGALAIAAVLVVAFVATRNGDEKKALGAGAGASVPTRARRAGGATTTRDRSAATSGTTDTGPTIPGKTNDAAFPPDYVSVVDNGVTVVHQGDQSISTLDAGVNVSPNHHTWAMLIQGGVAKDDVDKVRVGDAVGSWSKDYQIDARVNKDSFSWTPDGKFLLFGTQSDSPSDFVAPLRKDGGALPLHGVHVSTSDSFIGDNARTIGRGSAEELWICDDASHALRRVVLDTGLVVNFDLGNGDCNFVTAATPIMLQGQLIDRPIAYRVSQTDTMYLVRHAGSAPEPVLPPDSNGWNNRTEEVGCLHGDGSVLIAFGGDDFVVDMSAKSPLAAHQFNPICPEDSRFVNGAWRVAKVVQPDQGGSHFIDVGKGTAGAPDCGCAHVTNGEESFSSVRFSANADWVFYRAHITGQPDDYHASSIPPKKVTLNFSDLGLSKVDETKACFLPKSNDVLVSYTDDNGASFAALVDPDTGTVVKGLDMAFNDGSCSISPDGDFVAADKSIMGIATHNVTPVAGKVYWVS